ncbi:hypothetical protein OC846_005021 [Tilletia horrida]|uniref:NudC domain-containing protein 1 n=1 Tax=Tilletia horrida TaxID=155126 RepID=A0AAN6GM88_9BASI|nr:hypothetical protein OC845_005262 [Tilletia horrida]KAK0547042.1 hypothetical protein OC846_005021 [Tilletia horrida]KAK0562589.1 hypothetical protein OC861_005238 [Tilletia horrida]
MTSPVLSKDRGVYGSSSHRFESYRLAASSSSALTETQLSFELPADHLPRPPFASASYSSEFAGKHHAHIFDRFLTNYLAPGPPSPSGRFAQAAYINQTLQVVLIQLDSTLSDTDFHPIHQLASSDVPQSDRAPGVAPQAPSLIALDDGSWLVGDGQGLVSHLTISYDAEDKPMVGKVRSALVQTPQGQLLPIKLLSGQKPERFLAQTIWKDRVTVSAYTFTSPIISGSLWTATSAEPVLFAHLHSTASDLVGSAGFSALQWPTTVQKEQKDTSPSPAPESPATSARNGPHPFTWYQTRDSLTVSFPLPAALAPTNFSVRFKPHHISIDVDLPDELRLLELSSGSEALSNAPTTEAKQPVASSALALERISSGAYSSSSDAEAGIETGTADGQGRMLWGDIDSSASFWTWERPSQRDQDSIGYFTLHLEKRHHGTRWTHLFAKPRIAHQDGLDDQDIVSRPERSQLQHEPMSEDAYAVDDVPETLDPSERLTMLEGLEKYTSDMGCGDAAKPLLRPSAGLGAFGASSSLLEDGFEEEDANVGRDAYLLQVEVNATQGSPSTLSPQGSRTKLLGTSLPAPPSSSSSHESSLLVIKDDIDGLVFQEGSSRARDQQGESTLAATKWQHINTLPALAYVLASKQDASHRVHAHLGRSQPGRVQVLAFEGSPPSRIGTGSGTHHKTAGAGNLFVYYSPVDDGKSKGGPTHSESRVIRLGAEQGPNASASGSLIATARITQQSEAGHRDLLMILCENRLLVLPHLLL